MTFCFRSSGHRHETHSYYVALPQASFGKCSHAAEALSTKPTSPASPTMGRGLRRRIKKQFVHWLPNGAASGTAAEEVRLQTLCFHRCSPLGNCGSAWARVRHLAHAWITCERHRANLALHRVRPRVRRVGVPTALFEPRARAALHTWLPEV